MCVWRRVAGWSIRHIVKPGTPVRGAVHSPGALLGTLVCSAHLQVGVVVDDEARDAGSGL
jgi:hypothetical protein